MSERSGPFTNSLDELIGYLEDKILHGETNEVFDDLYTEYQKCGHDILQDAKMVKLLKKLNKEVNNIG